MFSWLNPIVYARVEQNSFDLLHAQSNTKYRAVPATPFASTRLAVANFGVAQATLKAALPSVLPNGIFKSSPTLVIHQVYLSEGGLSEVEERVIRELGYGAGARKVYVWQGQQLSVEQLLNRVYIGGRYLHH
jgi:hypothetical protein